MDEKKAINHLKDLKNVLEEYEIDFWLEDGTLLGAFRDKGMIPWDKCDIDIGAFRDSFRGKEKRKKITKALAKKGFTIYFFEDTLSIYRDNFIIDVILPIVKKNRAIIKRAVSKNTAGHFLIRLRKLSELSYYGGFKLKSSLDSRVLMKTNFFNLMRFIPSKLRRANYRLSKFLLSRFSNIEYYHLTFPKEHFSKLKTINYCDIEVNIPSLTEKYLERKYGDWRNPPKNPEKWVWWEHGSWVKNNPKNL